MIFALFGVSMPNFWLGLMLILLFSLKLGWLPSGGSDGLEYLILPAATVGLGLAALITRTTRSAMLDVIRADYMTTARAKGCPNRRVIYYHGLRNAMIPVITFLAMTIADIVAGSIVVEQVFAVGGVGQMLVTSIGNRDYPVVQAIVALIAVVVVVCNFLADALYRVMDPRLRQR